MGSKLVGVYSTETVMQPEPGEDPRTERRSNDQKGAFGQFKERAFKERSFRHVHAPDM